jgi:hypothetical protein
VIASFIRNKAERLIRNLARRLEQQALGVAASLLGPTPFRTCNGRGSATLEQRIVGNEGLALARPGARSQ